MKYIIIVKSKLTIIINLAEKNVKNKTQRASKND